jgi:hypothetical protein
VKSGNLKGKGYISALAYNFLYCVRAPPSLSSQLRNTAERRITEWARLLELRYQ